MAANKRNIGLQTIFSFFLGLMLAVFIGLGVYTFYPDPHPHQAEIRQLDDDAREFRSANPPAEMTLADREHLQDIQDRRMELVDAAEEVLKSWRLRTSIVLIILSTVVLAVSLVRAEKLPVVSNGLLLGGVFTMLYGVGWIVGSENSLTRFLVMTVALAITVGLGYVRFARRTPAAPSAAEPAEPAAAGLADIERRVGELETRIDRIARAFGPGGEQRPEREDR